MYIEELKEVINLLNENNKYEDIDLTFENFKEGIYKISFLEESQKSWNGESTCEFLEIYEVTRNTEKIGYIGRIVGKSTYGMQYCSEFNIAIEEMVLKSEWRLI